MNSTERKPLYTQLLPWIFAFAIFAYLFWRIDINQFIDALNKANLYIYIPWLIIFVILWFFIDCQNLVAIFRNFNHEISFREVLALRGFTYLLLIINWSVGAGGIAYFLKRDKNIPLLRGASLMFFYSNITQFCLNFMAIIGCLLAPVSSPLTEKLLLWCLSMVILNTIFLLVYRRLPIKGIFKKIKNIPILNIFNEVTISSFFTLSFYRAIYYSTFIIFYYLTIEAFDIEIPIMILTAYVPMILLIISLPITPLGMGTSHAAMLFLFKDYSTEPNILAFGITYTTSIFLLRGLIGLLYVKKISQMKSDNNNSNIAGVDTCDG